jgi:hypothetical protein
MLDAATVVDSALACYDEAHGHKFDRPRGDSASSLTPLEERSRRQHWDDRDLHNIISSKDAHGLIKNQC